MKELFLISCCVPTCRTRGVKSCCLYLSIRKAFDASCRCSHCEDTKGRERERGREGKREREEVGGSEKWNVRPHENENDAMRCC